MEKMAGVRIPDGQPSEATIGHPLSGDAERKRIYDGSVGDSGASPAANQRHASSSAATTPRTSARVSEEQRTRAARISEQIAKLQLESEELMRQTERDSLGAATGSYSPYKEPPSADASEQAQGSTEQAQPCESEHE